MNTLAAAHPLVDGRTTDAPLIRALRGDRPEITPVWFMRQAGRSLPEYRALRADFGMIEACLRPEITSEITLQPVRRHGVDAAILFSDIVIPFALAGINVDIVAGRGPVFAEPIRTAAQVEYLRREHTPERLRESIQPITDAVSLTVAELGNTPLIGFAGAPFTLASYLVEGGPSRDHLTARSLMRSEPETWNALLEWTAALCGTFLEAQVTAGASAVQLFDSWAGSLSAETYRTNAAWASAQTLSHVAHLSYPEGEGYACTSRTVPSIHFAVGAGHLLEEIATLDTTAIGVDWRTRLDQASTRLGDRTPLQGNLDPAYLAAPSAVLDAHVDDVITQGLQAPAHILNLGHGVPPEADPSALTRIVERAHA